MVVALAMVVEEFPARRRARALGRLFVAEALGTIVVALLLAAGLSHTPLGWRAFFLAGLPVLVPMIVLRRRLRETARFVALGPARPPAFLSAWRHGGRRLLAVGRCTCCGPCRCSGRRRGGRSRGARAWVHRGRRRAVPADAGWAAGATWCARG
ncbi:MAG: hypothetical protein L0H84_12750 [Pseudonocardia sp.]|nr:hypothetical protein [Pseudonocardia sp.]